MKKSILFICLLFVSTFVISQTQLFHENFELPSLADSVSMDSAGFAVNQWAISTTLASQGLRSDSCSISQGDTMFLTTNAFSTLGSSVAYLDFSHICKIEFFDAAEIYVSNNNGATWTKIIGSQYMGAGNFANIGNKFTSTSYTLDWLPAQNAAIPTNSWWKDERFDISSVAANSAQVKVRFQLTDMNNTGSGGNYGWLIDNIVVWKPAPQEASAEGIHLPLALPSGCGLGNEIVEMRIANNGSAVINGGLSASFQRDNGTVTTETVANTIIPGDTLVYTFTSLINLSSTIDTNYQIKAWVTLTGDFYHVNDTVTDSVESKVALPYPAINDTTIPYGTSVLLHATHTDSIAWYSDPLAQNLLVTGANFTTPILFDTAVFYVQAGNVTGAGGNIAPLAVASASPACNTGPCSTLNDLNFGTCGSQQMWITSSANNPGSSVNVTFVWPTAKLINKMTIHVGSSTTRFLTGGTVQAWIGSAWVNHHNFTQSTGVCSYDINFPNVTTTQLRIINMTVGGSQSSNVNFREIEIFEGLMLGCPSAVKAVTVNVSAMPLYNSGVTEIVSPVGAVTQNSTHPVKVAIKNYAADTLKKVTIGYSVNGVLKTPYIWTGNLLYNDTTHVTIGSEYFAGGVYGFKAWTSMPNDSLDGYTPNDTAMAQAYVCLGGTFTLGSPTSDFPDFASLNTIITNVGVCGNTVINILPGTYTHQFSYAAVNGVTDSTTLTFQSSTSNPADVIIQYASTAAYDGVVKLTGSSYLTFKNMTLKATGSTYGYGVNMTAGSHHNKIEGCIVDANATTTSGNFRAINLYLGAVNHHNTFLNNEIIGGYYGIYCRGASTASLAKGNVFEGNEIKDYYYYGAYNYYLDSVVYKNNIFTNRSGVSTSYGTRLYYCDGIQITGNKILLNSTGTQYGMYVYYCDSTSSYRGLIANNMISNSGGTGTHYGIYYRYGNGCDFLYNSFYNINGSTSCYPFYVYNSSTSYSGHNIYNNNIHNAGGGYNIYVYNNSYLFGADNNNIYGPSASTFAYWGGTRSSLAALKAAYANRNQNSISVNPQYVSATDLHASASALNASAQAFNNVVNTDIDGQPRDSLTPDIGADEFIILPDDAGIFDLVSSAPCPGDTSDIIVTLKNFGTDTLFTAIINWAVNDTLQSPVNFSDTLLVGQTTDIFIGQYVFNYGINYKFESWSSNPNGPPDGNPFNDTLTIYPLKTALSTGTYTIGGATANYPSISSAVNDLISFGVCGPVVFNINPGTYTGQVEIPQINGASTTNTITFQSSTGDSTSVTLTYATTSAANHVLWLNGADYIIIKHLKIVATGSTYGVAVKLNNEATHNSFLNNHFIGTTPPANTSSYNSAIIYASYGNNSFDSCNVYRNNYFYKGYCGIVDNNSSALNEHGLEITDNIFIDHSYIAVSLYYLNKPIITGNTVLQRVPCSSTNSSLFGFYVYRCTNGAVVESNKIHITNASPNNYGITIRETVGTSANPIEIANNFVSLESTTGISSGIKFSSNTSGQSVNYADVFYNSVNITGSGTNSRAFEIEKGVGTISNISLLNNVLANNAGGFAFYADAASGYTSNYNDLYTTGSYLGYNLINRANLAAWKSATAMDSMSVSADPSFFTATNLHVNVYDLNGAGIPIAGITTDIDGDIRNTTTPDIGADEFTPSPYNLATLEILSPTDGCGLDTNELVTIRIKNVGSASVTGGFTANFKLDANATVTETISSTLLPGDTLDHTFNTTVNLDVSTLLQDSTYELMAWIVLSTDPVNYNDTAYSTIESAYQPPPPTFVSPVNITYGNSATLTASSPDSIMWFENFLDTVEVGTGSTFITPLLYDTTTFWVQAGASGGGLPDSLTTTFVGGNSQLGNMFDITTFNTVTIDGFYINVSTSGMVEVWYRPGTYVGHTSSNTGWTKLGDYSVTSAGTGNPTPLPVGGLTIPANQTYGIYITHAVSGTMTYTNGNGTNQSYQDANIKFDGGHGGTYFSLTFTPRVWNGRIVYHTGGAGGSGCPSARVPLVVQTSAPPANDAGISQIVNPVGSAPSGVPHEIKVEIKNYGTATLQSANIQWKLNGVLQDSVAWTGSLLNDSTEVVILDTMIFTGGIYCIDSWTTFPNGVLDIVNANDSSNACFNACLAGTYTIGATNADFATFNAAKNALLAAGICGNVTFLVDSGIYNEQLTLTAIPGVGPNATITFQGATGDSTDVKLTYSSGAVLYLNGADYFTFKNMSIVGTGSAYYAIQIANGAMHNVFESNVISVANSSSSSYRTIYDYTTLNHYNTYKNNLISGGYYSVMIYGVSTTSWQVGTVIEGNEIINSYYYPMYIYYSDSVQIINNYIHNGASPYSYGIHMYYINNEYRVMGNRVEIVGTTTSACYGMREYYGNYYSYNANPSGYGIVANNMITISGGTGTNYGYYAYYGNGVNYYYNSISLTSGNTSSRCLYQYNTASNTLGQSFVNNIFSNTAGGYAAYFNTYASVVTSDYNDFYTSGSYFVYWNGARANLAALQTASGKDAHSVSIPPPFTSATDLHLTSTTLSGLGTPIAAVTVDIDGTPRSQSPTIGADEMPLIPIDAGVSNIISPITNAILNEGASIPVNVQVTNFGTDTIFAMNIQYSVNNGTPVTVAYNDTLLSAATDIVTMPTFIAPAGNSSICAKTALVGDTNYFNDEYCQPFFGTPAKDAYVTRIEEIEEGCGLGLDTVMIWIQNLGVDTINGPTSTTMTAHYQLDGISTIVNENMNLTINPGDSALFAFNTLANFAVTTTDSIFDVAAWVNLTGDNVSYNDTAYIEVESKHTPADPIVTSPVTVPYASPATISAISPTNDTLIWTDSLVGGTILGGGPTYTTGIMYLADTFYVQAGTASGGSGANIALNAIATHSGGGASPSYGPELYNDGNIPPANVTGTGQWGWVSTNGWIEYTWATPQTFDKVVFYKANRPMSTCTFQYWNGSSYVNFYNYNNSATDDSVIFPPVTATKLRFNALAGYSNPNHREIEVYAVGNDGCASNKVAVIVNVSAPSSCDVGVYKITQPVSAIYLSNNETVSVKVRNYGTVAQTNIPVSYQVNNGTIISDIITSTILPGDSLTYSFSTTVNVGVVGNTYQFKAWTALNCDSVPINDTTWSTVQNLVPNYCPSNATSTAYTDIGNVTFNAINNTSPPTYTAQYTDYTNTTPAMINQGNTYPISVTLNQATTTNSNGFVEVYIDYNRNGVYDEATETAFGTTYSGSTSSNPVTVTGNITVPAGAASGLSQMRVVAERSATSTSAVHPCGTYSYGETEDYSVMLAPSIPNDAGVIDIIQPTTIAANATTPIEVIVVNYGTDSITNVDVFYELNSGTPVLYNWTGVMHNGDSVYITYPAVNLPTGQNQICAYTTLANDSNAFNDQKCINSYVQHVTSAPYVDNFEGADYWLPDTLANQWERGIPSTTNINSAHSPQNVWMIDLNSTYANNSFDYLYTPKFNFATVTPDSIKFWHYYNSQSNNDGGRIQYLNVSGYWINMGSQNDPNGTNWYNTFNGVPFWSGNSNGWVESSYLLSAVTGMTNPAQFRFVFQSNASSNNFDGWAIDDFEITIPKMANDPGVTAIISPLDSVQIAATSTVEITIKNFGANTLLSVPVHYQIGSNSPVNETWTGVLTPGATVNYTFATTYVSPSVDYSLCTWATGVNPTYTFNDSICKNIIAKAAANDVGLCYIEEPFDTLYCDVKVWIKNYGLNSVNSVDVFYHLNGVNEVTATWTGNLNTNDSAQFIFPGQANAPLGMFNFCAGTDYTGDMNHSNDSLCKSIEGIKCDIGFSEIGYGGFVLNQNIPNPTNGTTRIEYTVPTSGKMRFDMFNVLGQSMLSQEKTVMAGTHTIELFVGDLPAGVYYYSVIFEGKRLVKKMLINR